MLRAILFFVLVALCGCSESPTGADGRITDAGAGESRADDTISGVEAGEPADSSSPGAGDTDGDGLPDAWEAAAGDGTRLDWKNADTDGDGVSDGLEDFDGDGLTARDEYAASRLAALTQGSPHPFRVDLLIELDAMQGYALPQTAIDDAQATFAALPTPGVAGHSGVGLHIYADEMSIGATQFSGDDSELRNFFATHGAQLGDGLEPPIPESKMVHVAVVSLRTDTPATRAQTISLAGGGSPDETGVLIYQDAIEASHPACTGTISVSDAFATALIHELGHTLQLGHDTSVGGGVNFYNIMALASDCTQAAQRFFGVGNSDPSLGATEAVGKPRFSAAAAALMDFNNKLSVDTAALVNEGGVDM